YRRLLEENREGLVLGTACYLGELYQAILKGEGEDRIKEIAGLYDYFEIQPDTNNEFLVRDGRVRNIEELRRINSLICEYGEKYSKPVVATCDAHFLSKEDKKFREVIMLAIGYDEAKADLYFRTTDEMLKEFSYLGEKKAKEVVVYNTEKINEMIDEDIPPVPKDLSPPIIENSDVKIKEATLAMGEKIYGPSPPDVIKSRIEKELGTIIKNNYSVLYLIAKQMVEQSKKDGYIVGSRGSVGSSMVAFLCGISEVNPMPAHYRCEKCFFTEFIKTKLAGIDLPKKKCSGCGAELIRDGYNIPFETFLGFDERKKIPDIDLNFSGEYQERIHAYVRNLFGESKVYKAGTISTLQTQAVKKDFMGKYMQKTGVKMRKAEQQRLVNGCLGVKRSTGQHPGALMLVPEDKEIYDFTPIQFSPKKDSITTHFDYRWIHDALVKLDALGHDMPTSLKRICEGIDKEVDDIPLDDPKTMKLFSGVKVLEVNPENYDVPVGTLGVPEVGTKFVREMLHFTKPTTFSELVYISGLSHGTDVWLGNAKELIKEKKAGLKDVISVRDDIMNYLIEKGLDAETAFEITESVRKGKGLSREWETVMRAKKVPEWYIESCKKIKYMFPKAHAVAYTMMSVRIAYIKLHYPVYFYADYYNRTKDGFEFEFLDMDMDRIKKRIRDSRLTQNPDKKEADRIKVLEVLFEMRERGFEFLDVGLYESEPDIFRVKDGKIMPPLSVIPELGKQAAKLIEEERKKGMFSSVEDFKKRTGVNKNVLEFMKLNGYLGNMPESEQTVLF
ncbi:MAG TPA: PolC-type DNA polymerase III, partial [Firmicutes bacterium]|nr:PolC-type DNA polymerase III [Bacillota bacterium]